MIPPLDSSFFPRRWLARVRPAFTLVELLVVMAIIVALLAATGPVVRGILGTRNVSDGVDAISGYLAYARTQAITQNTYVVVGFYQGVDDLQIAGVVSTSGTFTPANFGGTGHNLIGPAANYPALGRTVHVSNVGLQPWSNLGQPMENKVSQPDGAKIIDCQASPSYYSFPVTVGSTTNSFSSAVIAFTPQGEALFFPSGVTTVSATLPFYSQLFIGLRGTRGGVPVSSDVNSAAITVDGGSGDIKVYRL